MNNDKRPHQGGPTHIGEMYSVAGDRIENPREMQLIRDVLKFRSQGLTLVRVAATLNKIGYKNRRGNSITSHNVWWILNKTPHGRV